MAIKFITFTHNGILRRINIDYVLEIQSGKKPILYFNDHSGHVSWVELSEEDYETIINHLRAFGIIYD